MDESEDRKPLLEGRGFVRVQDFCLSTGLDQSTVDELMRMGRLDGALVGERESASVVGIFEDALPSREALAALGLPVRDDFDPQALRYGGIECQTHGWQESLLLTRRDPESDSEIPDASFCWACSRAGVSPDGGNSIPIARDSAASWVMSLQDVDRT